MNYDQCKRLLNTCKDRLGRDRDKVTVIKRDKWKGRYNTPNDCLDEDKDALPHKPKVTIPPLKETGKKQSTPAVVIAGCSTALLGAAIAVTLFATGTVAVELMSMMIAAAIVTAAALAVGGITYSILKPSTKMDETKEAQNVNGNVPGGGKEGQGGDLTQFIVSS